MKHTTLDLKYRCILLGLSDGDLRIGIYRSVNNKSFDTTPDDWIYPILLLAFSFVLDPLVILTMALAIYSITPLHELSHYVAARIVGARPKNVFLSFNLFSLLYIREYNMLGFTVGSHKRTFGCEGFVSFDDKFLTASGAKQAFVYLAGPMCNLMIGFGCLALFLVMITIDDVLNDALMIFIMISVVLHISAGFSNLNIYRPGNDGHSAINAIFPDYIPRERFF